MSKKYKACVKNSLPKAISLLQYVVATTLQGKSKANFFFSQLNGDFLSKHTSKWSIWNNYL